MSSPLNNRSHITCPPACFAQTPDNHSYDVDFVQSSVDCITVPNLQIQLFFPHFTVCAKSWGEGDRRRCTARPTGGQLTSGRWDAGNTRSSGTAPHSPWRSVWRSHGANSRFAQQSFVTWLNDDDVDYKVSTLCWLEELHLSLPGGAAEADSIGFDTHSLQTNGRIVTRWFSHFVCKYLCIYRRIYTDLIHVPKKSSKSALCRLDLTTNSYWRLGQSFKQTQINTRTHYHIGMLVLVCLVPTHDKNEQVCVWVSEYDLRGDNLDVSIDGLVRRFWGRVVFTKC